MGGKLFTAVMLGAIGFASYMQCHVKPSSDVIEEFDGPNFDATTKTEYIYGGCGIWHQGKTMEFLAENEGTYLIESWNARYRNTDELSDVISFEVDRLPFERVLIFGEDVYRVEITYSDGKTMERSTLNFPE
jgi:hypothetical protein